MPEKIRKSLILAQKMLDDNNVPKKDRFVRYKGKDGKICESKLNGKS